MCQYFHTVLRHQISVFPLGAGEFVFTNHFPPVRVFVVYEDTPCARVDHWLYGKGHTRNEQHSRSSVPVVFYLRFFVEVTTDTMTAKITHYAETICMGMLLNGIAKITYKYIRLRANLLADLQALPCHIHKALLLRRGATYNEHSAGIGIVSV